MSKIRPRDTLNRQIDKLNQDILVLGSMVEEATLKAVDSLQSRDLHTARLIYRSDRFINERRFKIEEDCLTTIATQQPIARDLRKLSSILEVNTELERMGDYAKGIARITLMIGNLPPLIPLYPFKQMAQLTAGMLHRALTAFVNADEGLAREIPDEDEAVDLLYNQVNLTLIQRVSEEPGLMDGANHLMLVSHNLHRMADRVTNICERTVFIASGSLVELAGSRDGFFVER